MSKIAEFSYKAVATVKPFLGRDDWSGQTTYGEEYSILCDWSANSEQQRDQGGAEFVSRHIIYTQDLRPQYLDLIKLDALIDWQEIRSRLVWDMTWLKTTPDIKLVT